MTKHILDHGYITLIESWGSDEAIIEAARMSTGKGFEGWEKDEKLLAYLYKHAHWTPFEMAGMVVEVKAPIMVFREWHRHRSMGYNEASARYIPLPDENYLPTVARLMAGANTATTNRQAQGAGRPLNIAEAGGWLGELRNAYAEIQRVYERGLTLGIPKELARLPVPVGRYSKMRATTNLRMWLTFLTLRMAPNAQYEIRVYANAVADVLRELFPRTMKLFDATPMPTVR